MNTSSLISKLSIAALRFRFVKPALAASVLLAAALGNNAQAYDNWVGGSTGNFSNNSNWTGGSPNGQQITFANFLGSSLSSYSVNNDLTGATFGGIFINGPSSVTFSGNAFTLNSSGGNPIQLNTSSTITINNNITLTDASDAFISTGGSGDAITLNGNISGTGTTLTTSGSSVNEALTFNTGTVTLAGLVTDNASGAGTNYAGSSVTTFSGSTLNVSGGITLGIGTLNIASGTTATVAGNITSNQDWASFVMTGGSMTAANVAIQDQGGDGAGGQVILNGGTLTTGSISAIDWESPGSREASLLVLNGTQIDSSANSSSFISTAPGVIAAAYGVGTGANVAYIATGGLLLNTEGFNDTIGAQLADLTPALVSYDSLLTSGMAGPGSLTKSGLGSLTLTAANTYSGGTTITGGTLYVNNTSGSGTGSGAVTVQTGGTLAGKGIITGPVTVQSGGVIASGPAQTNVVSPTNPTGVDTVTGPGLTVDLAVNGGSTLQFDLGAGASTGYLNYASPNLNSTSLTSTGPTTFGTTGGNVNISLVDLTAFSASDTLQLRSQNPYLLISAAGDSSYNLVTTGGYDANGLVLGIGSSGTGTSVLNGFNITAQDINGGALVAPYNNLQLYLYNGQLEVIPEPGTWALMLGGLALLVLIQRRRRDHSA
jgi:autotransporter-associated beta strand protein